MFIILCALAAWHFLADGILAPTLRMSLRNKLFAQRDQIRYILCSAKLSKAELRAAKHVEDSICNFINSLHRINLITVYRFNQFVKENPKVKTYIKQDYSELVSDSSEEIKKVIINVGKIYSDAMFINSVGWFIYLIPIVVGMASVEIIRDTGKRLVITPIKDINKFFDDNDLKTA